MKPLKKPVHSPLYEWIRTYFADRRKDLGLSQRALAQQMDVIFSVIGKIETGDRRLDVLEFMDYCEALGLEPDKVFKELQEYRATLEE